MASLSIGGLGSLNLDVGNVLASSGPASFAVGSTLNISNSAAIVVPDLLMTYSGSANGTFTNVNGLPATDQLYYSPGSSLEIVSAGLPTWSWNQSGGGSWTTAGYWTPSGIPTSGTVTFPELGATSPITVTLDGPQTAGALVFSASEGYTLAAGNGGSLTLANSATVTLLSGTHTISAPLEIALGSLVVSASNASVLNISGNISDDNGQESLTLNGDGTGQLILSGTNNTYGGGTIVEAGTLIVNNSGALPAGSSLTVGAGGTFIFDPSVSAAGAVSAGAVVASVPEPGTLVLLAFGLWSAAIYRRFVSDRRPFGGMKDQGGRVV